MFNEMGHQLVLTKVSLFRKSCPPCIMSFLSGVVLRFLTGHSLGLDKAKLEVYAMLVGIYYYLNVDYAHNYGRNLVQ